MNITVTVTLAPEVLSLIEGFIKGIGGSSVTPDIKAPAKKNGVVKPAEETPLVTKPEPTAITSSEMLTVEQVRAKANAKIEAGKKGEVKALLTEFNSKSISSLPAENYTAFLEKLEAI